MSWFRSSSSGARVFKFDSKDRQASEGHRFRHTLCSSPSGVAVPEQMMPKCQPQGPLVNGGASSGVSPVPSTIEVSPNTHIFTTLAYNRPPPASKQAARMVPAIKKSGCNWSFVFDPWGK